MLRTPKVSLRTLEKDLDSWIREREMPEKSPQWCHAQVLQDHFSTLLVTVAVGWSSSGVQYLNLITYPVPESGFLLFSRSFWESSACAQELGVCLN